MDGRRALRAGTVLKLSTRTGYTEYFVRREIGRGGSCIVYDATTADNLGNDKLVRIKECYPHALRFERADDGSLWAREGDRAAFEAAKRRFVDAYQNSHALFMTDALTNAVVNTSNLYEENGTIYIVSTWLNGQTFADAQIKSLHDCVALVLSTARVLKNIHDAGFLYLDLKPENILTIKGSLDLVQLFDFDSMIGMTDLENAIRGNDPAVLRTSYTRGYAPPEQQMGKLRQISRHSDLYSLGAVLFEALWHRTPTAFDCEEKATYDFSSMAYPRENFQDALLRELTVFLRKTLASYHEDRYQDATQAIEQLERILALSDETKPWLFSTPIPVPTFFTGRESELETLSQLLNTPGQRVFNLYGMGGIGKSTLVRSWLNAHRDLYDAVLWLYDQGKTMELLCDDLSVHINTVRRMRDEPQAEYFNRKMRVLAGLAARQRILVIVDNASQEHMEDLRPLLNLGLDVLFISRAPMAEGLFPSFRVEELQPAALIKLFERYAHMEICGEQDIQDFETIANTVHGHTLTMELLGRQIERSYLTLREAAQMVQNAGFRALSGEKIDYIHDQQVFIAPLTKILDQLEEIDGITEEEKQLLQILSVVDGPGMQLSLLRELTSPEMVEIIHRLNDLGWLTIASRRIVFHPLMTEYIRSWPWTEGSRETLDGMLIGLHRKIDPNEDRLDLGRQTTADYGALYELICVSAQLLAYAKPISAASQLLMFRILMDAPVDIDEAVLRRMLSLLYKPKYLDPSCVLRLFEMTAFMLGRIECYELAHDVLKDMKGYLEKHPSHYYSSCYYRAKAVITNNQYGRKMGNKCLKYENAAIKEARASGHPDARRQLAAVLLNKTQTLLETHSKMRLCEKMLREADVLLQGYASKYDYERYHFNCVSAVYCARIGDEEAALAHMRSATESADIARDSQLSFIEHLLDEAAVVYIELGRFHDAAETVTRAIAMCDEYEDNLRYREVRFDAYLFLGRIYAMDHKYVKAEETFAEAEKRLKDSTHEWALPLCPNDIRERARAERASGAHK